MLIVLLTYLEGADRTLTGALAFWIVGLVIGIGAMTLFAYAEWEYRERQFRALWRDRGLQVPEVPP